MSFCTNLQYDLPEPASSEDVDEEVDWGVYGQEAMGAVDYVLDR